MFNINGIEHLEYELNRIDKELGIAQLDGDTETLKDLYHKKGKLYARIECKRERELSLAGN